MGTEVAVSFTTLQAQLESEKSTLYKIDESIKKIVQSPRLSDRFNKSSNDYGRGAFRAGQRNSFPENGNTQRTDELFGKRKQETKTVFSRITGRGNNSDGEEEPNNKRSRVHSAVSRELPSRAAVLKAQSGDEQARTRNKRIFGALLGTLQKFKQEEIGLQNKEDKKAQVEKKIEEQAKQQREKEILERKTLFVERENKKLLIRALEAKMTRVQEFELWEQFQKQRANYIVTKTKPPIYWLPKKMSDKSSELLKSSRSYHEKYMALKREHLKEELVRIEARCMRRPGPYTHAAQKELHSLVEAGETEDNIRRDKFATGAEGGAGDSEGEDMQREDKTPEEKMDTDTAPQDSNVTMAEEENLSHEPNNISSEVNTTSHEDNITSHEVNTTLHEVNITLHEANITLHEAEETTPEPNYSRIDTPDIAVENHISDANHQELAKEKTEEQ